MSKKDKLTERFKLLPKDFTFEELVAVFNVAGFVLNNKGNTSGSRVRLEKGDYYFNFHRPHPSNIIKQGVLKKALAYLEDLKLI